MKIFLTEIEEKGKKYAGPNIVAENLEEAEEAAKANNLIVVGYDEVYRSTTAGAIWDSVSFNVSNGAAIRSIALAPSNEDYIYAATYSKIKVTKLIHKI